MANDKPLITNLVCSVPESNSMGYHTDAQSHVNTAKKDKFRLVINIPPYLRPFLANKDASGETIRSCHGGNLDKMTISIWGNVLPEINVGKIDVGMGSQVLQFSNYSRPAYPPVVVNFSIDNKFDNYYLIYKWLDFLSDEESGWFDGKNISQSKGSIKDYSSIFTLQVLSEYEQIVAEFDYLHAFPITLGSINYNFREFGEIECSFSFTFNQLKMRLL